LSSSFFFPLPKKIQKTQEHSFITKLTPTKYSIAPGFVPNMRVPGRFYVNDSLKTLVDDELADSVARSSGEDGNKGGGGFLPAVKQVANVAALPGIVGASLAMPDLHSGYGFAIGNVAAFDTADPEAVVSPGGVGFDINCGVRLLRTNLTEAEVSPLREQLAQSLFDHIPVGVGSQGIIPTTAADLDGVSIIFFALFSFRFSNFSFLTSFPFLCAPPFLWKLWLSTLSRLGARHGLVAAGRVRLGRGQGALRGGRANARRGPHESLAARQAPRPAAAGHAGRRQPLL
jgi:hypothetical protein